MFVYIYRERVEILSRVDFQQQVKLTFNFSNSLVVKRVVCLHLFREREQTKTIKANCKQLVKLIKF